MFKRFFLAIATTATALTTVSCVVGDSGVMVKYTWERKYDVSSGDRFVFRYISANDIRRYNEEEGSRAQTRHDGNPRVPDDRLLEHNTFYNTDPGRYTLVYRFYGCVGGFGGQAPCQEWDIAVNYELTRHPDFENGGRAFFEIALDPMAVLPDTKIDGLFAVRMCEDESCPPALSKTADGRSVVKTEEFAGNGATMRVEYTVARVPGQAR